MRLYMLEYPSALFAARIFALILSFSLGYLYNIYTSPSCYTPEHQNNQELSQNFAKTDDNKKQPQQNSNRETTEIRELQNNQCGLILFVHINKCAGGSLKYWFKFHAAGFMDLFEEGTTRVRNVRQTSIWWTRRTRAATSFVSSISRKKGWKVLHLHHGFPGVYYIQELIHDWQAIVERNGCTFHQTTMLRDPLDRFVSNVNYNKPPLKDINTFMESRKNWLSRYLLFGLCGYYHKELRCGYDKKGNFTMTPNLTQEYTKALTTIISRFNSIGFVDMFGEYLERIRLVTGWAAYKRNKNEYKRKKFPILHKSRKTFNLTSSILKKFLKTNQEDYLLYYTLKGDRKPNLVN